MVVIGLFMTADLGIKERRVCQKFKTTLYINQTRNLSESHLSCEFSLFLIFKYSEMPPKAFYKAKTDANMV